MNKRKYDRFHNEGYTAIKIIANMENLKSLSDLECMIWARSSLNDFDGAALCSFHSEMNDPVYNKLDSLFVQDSYNDNLYARLMGLIERRKMGFHLYKFLLATPKKQIREILGR